jgi:acetylornithine aminotransferase/acetylornithine/N-succinyldiaminopimelate aminotransferase
LSSAPEWAGTLGERGATALLPTYARYPVELVSGRGCRLEDSRGRSYLDLVAGIAVNALGHGHPAIVAALRQAADGLLHVSNLYWTEPMVRLAERLTAAAGMDRAFFCNSGAEAVESCLKLSRKALPGRRRILCFERSFHGRTLGALSATAQPWYQEGFRPLLPGVQALPFGDFEAAQQAIDDEVALVLVEPIQGEGGMRPAPSGWLRLLRERCDATGALLIFDEVQSGLGRTGTFFAYQGEGVVPDAVACAKALAGGLPMGALLVRGAAAEAFQPGDHASTFGGGLLVSAAAHAVLDVVLADGFLDDLRFRARRLRAGLERLAAAHPAATGVRGRGLMLGLQLAEPRAGELVDALRVQGALTCPAGADVVRFVPPLTISREEIDEATELVARALGALAEPSESK